MNRDLNKPQLYGVELRSAGYYNSGYLRFMQNCNGNVSIDGIFTEEYFRFDYAEAETEAEDNTIFIVLTIIESNKEEKHYAMVDLDVNDFSLEFGYYNFCVSFNDENDIAYFTLLNIIEDSPLADKILSTIDATQKAMTSS